MSRKPKADLETSVWSYLTARPSRDIIAASHQEITRQWWKLRSGDFELCISQAVIEECGAGNPVFAKERLLALQGLPVLDATEPVESLAKQLMTGIPLPPKALVDALHIAFCSVHAVNYLLTWNCTHIANAALKKKIEAICDAASCSVPVLCTPFELLISGNNHD